MFSLPKQKQNENHKKLYKIKKTTCQSIKGSMSLYQKN